MGCYLLCLFSHRSRQNCIRGLIVLADSANIPTAIVVCRHLFEWTAQVCYMNENLQKHIAARDWDAARDLLNQAIIGSRWIREYGHKYDPTQIKTDIPNAIRLKAILASYEAHVEKAFGGDTKDDYAHLRRAFPSKLRVLTAVS